MLKKLLILTLLIISGITVYGQGQANVWMFGTHAGLDFSGGSPTIVTGRTETNVGSPPTTGAEGEGYAAISDASGNLLFYTDGVKLWNAAGTVVTTGLNGAISAAQAAIIVPRPSTANRYYVFTVGSTGSTTGIYYNEVNATSGTAVTMIATNTPVWTGIRTMESLCVVPHFNGTDYWLICRNDGGAANEYRAYIITSTGVGAAVASSVGGLSNNGQGLMKTNSCYTKLAQSFGGQPGGNAGGMNRIEILSFNNNSGAITLDFKIDNFTAGKMFGPYGLEFSPNGDYLFMTELMMAQIYRYNITSGTEAGTEATRTLIQNAGTTSPHGTNIDNNVQSFPRTGHLQIGPDGIIYVANHNAWHYGDTPTSCNSCNGSGTLSTIEDPDLAAYVFTPAAITFPSGYAGGQGVSHGLPTLMRSFIAGNVVVEGPASICGGVSGTYTFTFGGIIWSGAGNYIEWIWGDNGTTVQNVNNSSPSHTYSNTGSTTLTFTITTRVKDECGRWWTGTKTVKVPPALTVTVTCGSGNPPTLNGSANYHWFNAACGGTEVGSGSTYTMPSFPGTIYVEDQTGVTTNTTVGAGPTFAYSYDKYTTDFVLNEPTTLKSVQFSQNSDANGGCTGSNTISVNSLPGNTPVACMTKTFTGGGYCNTDLELNFNLPAGSYRLVSTVVGKTATAYTTASNSAITVSTNGPFYNFKTQTYNSCSPRATIAVNNALCPSLPVTWLEFKATAMGNYNLLTWATAVEKNSFYFDVERSYDGVNFFPIGRVNAAGNSNQINEYSFPDVGADAGLVYYRLKQVDINHVYAYSVIVTVDRMATQGYSLVPNPGDGLVYLTGGNAEAQLTVNVLDVQGRAVQTNVNTHSGSSLDLTGLSKGVYLVQVISSGSVQTLRYVLQ